MVAIVRNRDDIRRVNLNDNNLAVTTSKVGCILKRADMIAIATATISVIVNLVAIHARDRHTDLVVHLACVMVSPIATETLVAEEVTIGCDRHIAMLKERIEFRYATATRILHQASKELNKRSRRDSILDKGQNLIYNSTMHDFTIEVDMTINDLDTTFRPIGNDTCGVDKIKEFLFGNSLLDCLDNTIPVLM
jgi:hypothetical protein